MDEGRTPDPFVGTLRASALEVELFPNATVDLVARLAPYRWLLAWLPALAASITFAFVAQGLERAVGVGAAIAFGGGAVLCLRIVQAERARAARELADTTAHLTAESDDRAAVVVRQFKWAIDDLMMLRGRLKNAEQHDWAQRSRIKGLQAETDAAREQSKRAQREVFELRAVDVGELRDARDAAMAARDASERRLRDAQELLERQERQLRSSRQRVDDLTTLFASLMNAREEQASRVAALQPEPEPVIDAEPGAATWALADHDGSLAVDVDTKLPARAIRLRDPAGATVLVKRFGRRTLEPMLARVADVALAEALVVDPQLFTVQLLVEDRWLQAAYVERDGATYADKRLRRWPGGQVIRIAT